MGRRPESIKFKAIWYKDLIDGANGPLERAGLSVPLFLPNQPGADPRSPAFPRLLDLFRAARRSLGELFRLYGEPIPGDAQAPEETAARVVRDEHCFEPFEQEHVSPWNGRR